ncbi:hypothetical protein BH09PLA1_BH09PLA1_26510 [soil metagenome]
MRMPLLTMLAGLLSIGFVRASLAEAVTTELPSFGIVAPLPEGWQRAREPDEAIAARWEFIDPKTKATAGVIDLQLYPKRAAASAKSLAMKEASRLHGKMNPDKVELAGVDAFEFRIGDNPSETAGTGLRVRIIRHADNYCALAERAQTDATLDAFEKFASAMKLSEPAPPSEALRLRKEPIALDAVQLVMDLPDPFRCASDDPKRQEYRVINFADGKSEVEMSVAPIATFGDDLDGVLKSLGRSLARQYGWGEPPVWHRIAGKFRVAYSDLTAAGKDAKGKAIDPMQLMIVVKDKSAQLLIFQYPGPADATAKYAAQCEGLARSVRADPAYLAKRAADRAAESK